MGAYLDDDETTDCEALLILPREALLNLLLLATLTAEALLIFFIGKNAPASWLRQGFSVQFPTTAIRLELAWKDFVLPGYYDLARDTSK